MAKPSVVLRSGNDGSAKEFSDSTAYVEDMPTLTQQQFKDDNNPNVVMERFTRTGEFDALYKSQPQYGDFTGANDFQTSLNIVLAAQEAFDALPARVRKRFNNDPAEFCVFLDDDKNFDEAKELGLLKPDAKSIKDSPRQDLSPPDEPPQQRSASGGGKSGVDGQSLPRASSMIPRGFKLVPEGDVGDD